jgi:hypothetical protein
MPAGGRFVYIGLAQFPSALGTRGLLKFLHNDFVGCVCMSARKLANE